MANDRATKHRRDEVMPERVVYSDHHHGELFTIIELFDEDTEGAFVVKTYVGGYDALISGVRHSLDSRQLPECILEAQQIIDRP